MKTNRPLTVISLLLSLSMAAMEMTVVSTAMPTVVGDLGGIHHYSWVFTAYLLTSTVTVPLYGKLADLYGRKPVLLAGIGVFLVGSMASGLARSIGALIAFRALQGLGAGAMQPTTLTIVGDIYNLEERSRMQGVFGAVWGVAGLLTLGLTALLFGVHGGRASSIGLPLAALCLALFYFAERRAPEPVLPLDLFRQPVIGVSTAAGALVGAGMIAMVTYVPLYVQGVLGGSPTEAGSAIAPMVIGWPIASAVSGRALPRVGFRVLVRAGLAISAVAAVALALLLRPGVSLHVPQALSALFGVGLGLANTALLIAVQTSVEWRQRGVATASTMFARTIGGTLAVGVLGAILSAALLRDGSLPPDAADQLLGPAHGAGLDPAVVRSLSVALQAGLGTVFWVIAAISVAAAATSIFFPHLPVGAGTPDRGDIAQPAEMSTLPPEA